MGNPQEIIDYAIRLEQKFSQAPGYRHLEGFAHRFAKGQTTRQDLDTLSQYKPGRREKPFFEEMMKAIFLQVQRAVQRVMQQSPSPEMPDLTVGNAAKEDLSKAGTLIKRCISWLKNPENERKRDGDLAIDMIEYIKTLRRPDIQVALFLMYSANGQVILGRESLIIATAIRGFFQYHMDGWLNQHDPQRVRFGWLCENIQKGITDYKHKAAKADPGQPQIYDLPTAIIKLDQDTSRTAIPPTNIGQQAPSRGAAQQYHQGSPAGDSFSFDPFNTGNHPAPAQAAANTPDFQPDFFAEAAQESIQQELQTKANLLIHELRKLYKNPHARSTFVQHAGRTLGQTLVDEPTLYPFLLGSFLDFKPDEDLMKIASAFLHVLPEVERQVSRNVVKSGSQQNAASILDQPYKKELLQRRVQIAGRVSEWIQYLENPQSAQKVLENLKSRATELNQQPFVRADLYELETLVLAYEYTDKQYLSEEQEKSVSKLIQALKTKADIGPALLQEHKNGGTETKKNGWQLLHFLAAGGMGAVFVAQQIVHGKVTGRKAAVKVALGDDETARRGFERESILLSGIEAPHIVRVYQAGSSEANTPYLVTEYVPGPTEGSGAFDGEKLMTCLAYAREQGFEVPVEALSLIGWSLAKGMQEYSEKGIIHRDLKPANCLLTSDASKLFTAWLGGQLSNDELTKQLHGVRDKGKPLVKWGDFGLATKPADKQKELFSHGQDIPESSQSKFTIAGFGEIVGTPHYMPPEAVVGAEENPYSYSDQYALGMMLFQLISGGNFPNTELNTAQNPLDLLTFIANYGSGNDHMVPLDHPELAPLLKHPNKKMKAFAKMIAQLTTCHPKESRGNIEEIERSLKDIRKSTTEEAKKDRSVSERLRSQKVRNRSFERRSNSANKLNKVYLGLLSGAAVVMMSFLLYIASMRPEKHVEFGGQRKATYAAMKHALEDENTSAAKLEALLERYQAELGSMPEGYEADQSVGEPSEEELLEMRENIKNAIAALGLIARGEEFLSREIPDVERARSLFLRAQEKSSSLAPVISQKLQIVSETEDLLFYQEAEHTYNKVSTHLSLSDMNALRVEAENKSQAALSRIFDKTSQDEQQRIIDEIHTGRIVTLSQLKIADRELQSRISAFSIDKLKNLLTMQRKLDGWSEKIQKIQRITIKLAELNGDEFQNTVTYFANIIGTENTVPVTFNDEVISFDESDSVTLLTYLRSVLIAIRDRDLSSIQSQHPDLTIRQIIDRSYSPSASESFQKLRELFTKLPFVTDTLFDVYKNSRKFPNPGTAESTQLVMKARVDQYLDSITNGFLNNRYRTALAQGKTYIENIVFLKEHATEHGCFIELPSGQNDIEGWSEQMIRQGLSSLQFKLNGTDRRRLYEWVSEHFPDNTFLVNESNRVLLNGR